MAAVYDRLMTCVESVRRKTDFVPKIALVLGSGLGKFGDEMMIHCVIPYKTIESFPVSTVEGHKGQFIFGYIHNVPVVAMQGRIHYYEGYSMEDVVLPVRLMKALGAQTLILTNAAGGVNYGFRPGDLMIIKDHISTMVPSPLIGANEDKLGPRFPDMSHVYSEALQNHISACGKKLGLDLKQGVYVQLTGPQYETPAEIKFIRTIGGDAVGMSTACEAIAAKHMGMDICGISCITNLACGMSDQPLNHEEVQVVANQVATDFTKLMKEIIGTLA